MIRARSDRRTGSLAKEGLNMQTWEYFVAPVLAHNPGEILNAFGDDGW